MTMHIMSPAYTTNNYRSSKIRMTKANIERWTKDLRAYNKLMKRCGSPILTIEEYIKHIHGKLKKERTFKPYKREETIFDCQSREHRERYPSAIDLGTSLNTTARKERPKYTGTYVIGIATMHKSNGVPVVNQLQATEIARMAK